MQIKLVEDELTHKELTYPMTPPFHLSVCLALSQSSNWVSITSSLIALIKVNGSSESFGQKAHSQHSLGADFGTFGRG